MDLSLREAITGYTGLSALLTRTTRLWRVDALGPTIAGLIQLFRPQKAASPSPAHQPAQPAVPEQPTQPQLNEVARRLTLPSPAVRPDQPSDASALAS